MIKITLLAASVMVSSLAHAQSITIEHSMGSTTLEQGPKRVVVLGVGPLDALDSFGIEPVAVTKFPSTPTYLTKYESDAYPSAGSLFEPDYENIFEQHPDLIISGPRNAKNYEELSKIAPTIIYEVDQNKDYWQSTQEQWQNLGKIFAIEPKVNQTIEKMDAQFKAIKQHNQDHPQKALMVMANGGKISAFGAASRFASLYQDFGFSEAVQGIKTGRHGDLVSYEFIHDKNPQVLFVLDRDGLVNKGKSTTRSDFDNDLVKSTDAYQSGKVSFLDINAWYVSIAGVQSTQQMIDDVKQVIEIQ